MCGIFGVAVARDSSLTPENAFELFEAVGIASQTRGRQGSGFLYAIAGETRVHRSSDAFQKLLASADYRHHVAGVLRTPAPLAYGGVIVGHARLATNGSQGIEANNQPVGYDGIYCLHNGIVVNADELWKDVEPLTPRTDVDSEIISALVHHSMLAGKDFASSVAEAASRIKGEASIAVVEAGTGDFALFTNNGSLYYVIHEDAIVFASEQHILRIALARRDLLGREETPIRPVPLRRVVAVRHGERVPSLIAPERPAPARTVAGAGHNHDGFRLRDTMLEAAARRRSLRRCTRCVLPETMPFIRFDEQGVCSYCRTYRPKQLLGEEALERVLAPHRSSGGRPDCVIAFSGGRDSSYALHLLKTRYGMSPIAYTYDWGMVTDIARRNQARMCGKLGVEHIWISANIPAKRRNIGANVRAWMHRPSLGMIPLFMAGDKQFFYHGHRTMKNTGIKLMVFATNHYEKTDFKIGFCGIPPLVEEHRPNYLNVARKCALLRYYLGQFLANPRYLNRSIPDTVGAFLSYYALDNEATFLHLFDYVPWNEEVIDRTLIGEYEWETATDSTSTWRIGDGTAAVYNYIYRTICGFSEQETFRSNQVREGVITRDEALTLVERESAPRYDAIDEYCSLIGVPSSELLSAAYRLQRLY